jgi:hypothetical protein
LGEVELVSTHNQVLNGIAGRFFLERISLPMNLYSAEISELGKLVAEELKKEGVIGRFSIDFISVKEKDQWKHYAIEINLRKGGTTHPFLMLQFLTNGHYDEATGLLKPPISNTVYYFARIICRTKPIRVLHHRI